MACFIAYPAHLAAYSPHHNVRKQLVNGVAQVGNVVECLCIVNRSATRCTLAAVCTTVISGMIATRCTVKPHLKLVGTILRQLYTLGEKHLLCIVVGVASLAVFLAPIDAAEVPRRHVESVFHLQLARCTGKVARNICLAGCLGG